MSESMTAEELEHLSERISAHQFDTWYRERTFAENIEQGTPYFNGPSPVPDPELHSPSRLLACHRKTYYHHHNAPKETPIPEGIFWFGSRFETDIALPFLRDLVGPDYYVRNSIWVDFTVCTAEGELRFRGETDPVIVDSESEPYLLTEIKTTSSIAALDTPKNQHKAQAHAYMYGLSEKYERTVRNAVILYGNRDDFTIRSFHVEFDPWFWRDVVLDWAATNTAYRSDKRLPPGTPESSWECEYCAFQHRCGQGGISHTDTEPSGLLPDFEYPRQRVVEYLESHPLAKLTPTVANQYPELAERHDVCNWWCQVCGDTYPFSDIEWEGDLTQLPQCPTCRNENIPVSLRAPPPYEQSVGIKVMRAHE